MDLTNYTKISIEISSKQWIVVVSRKRKDLFSALLSIGQPSADITCVDYVIWTRHRTWSESRRRLQNSADGKAHQLIFDTPTYNTHLCSLSSSNTVATQLVELELIAYPSIPLSTIVMLQRTVARSSAIAGRTLVRAIRPQIATAGRRIAATSASASQRRSYHEKDKFPPVVIFHPQTPLL